MVVNSNIITQETEQIINPIQRPTVTHELSENVILTTIDDLYNWSRLSSLWPLLFGTACCFIEFAALIGSRFDFDRFGLIPRCSPPSSRFTHYCGNNYHEDGTSISASL